MRSLTLRFAHTIAALAAFSDAALVRVPPAFHSARRARPTLLSDETLLPEATAKAAQVISGAGGVSFTPSEGTDVLGSDYTNYEKLLEEPPEPLSDDATEKLMAEMAFVEQGFSADPNVRGVFCTRSLDLNQIKVIGYDMDYTLIDYKMELWEERAYYYSKELLRTKGFPVSGLTFNPELVTRGLIIDKECGNLLKVDRFGYVRRGMHGTRHLSKRELLEEYGRLSVDLRDSRWTFLNTLFSVSEGVLYAQLIDRLDSGQLLAECKPPFEPSRCSTYEQLFSAVSRALFKAHVQGSLKQEIMEDPMRFVNCDPAFPRVLLDQRNAGKKLCLITNSDWIYTNKLMSTTYDLFLPEGMVWKDLFDLIIVSAMKPDFFSESRRPLYEMVTPDGLLREHFRFEVGKAYAGGNAQLVEKCFDVSGPQVLYVGDHIFTDVNIAKRGMRWRTCVILQELELEIAGIWQGREVGRKLDEMRRHKEQLATVCNYMLNELRRFDAGSPTTIISDDATSEGTPSSKRMHVVAAIARLQSAVQEKDDKIQELMRLSGAHVNVHWGYMSRAGFADKSHLMRQIEKYADIYTSRVSNLLIYTPYKHFLSPRQSLAHDGPPIDVEAVMSKAGAHDTKFPNNESLL